MGRRSSRKSSHSSASSSALTVAPPLPAGPVATSTGTAEVVVDPESSTGVTLYVNGVPSSHLDLADPGLLTFEYMQQMAAVIDQLAEGPLRAVHLGAAGCTVARYIEHERPDSRQIGIDLDARLMELVREWFALPRSPRLRLRVGDARAELASLPSASADVVVRDVFAGDATPAHVMTAGFTREVLRVLRPGGVYLANCADRPPLSVVRRELATIAAALSGEEPSAEGTEAPEGVLAPPDGETRLWAQVAMMAEPAQLKGRRHGNFVLAAVRRTADGSALGAVDLAGAGLARALRSLSVPARLVTASELERFVADAAPYEDPVPVT